MKGQGEIVSDTALENSIHPGVVEIPDIPEAPKIKRVVNPRLGSLGTYSSGHSFLIEGSSLEINQLDSDEGVFLIPLSDDPEYRVSIYIINRRSELLVLVPLSIAGPQHLQIRTRDADGEILVTVHPVLLQQA